MNNNNPNQKIVGGNPNLKGTDYKEVITKDEYNHRIQEIIKCKEDIVYFANTYFTIISPGKGKHTIQLYPKQEELLRFMADEDRVICLAARQIGKCCCGDTYVNIKNKRTNKIEEVSLSQFHEMIKANSINHIV